MLDHCKTKFGFDFLEIRHRLGLDFYENVKLVNYIRSQVHSGHIITSDISKDDFKNDKFLKPVLEDDALLISLDDLPEREPDASENVEVSSKNKAAALDPNRLVTRVSQLEEELRRIQSHFDDYRETVKQTLDDRWNDKPANGTLDSGKTEKRDDDSHYFVSYSYNGSVLTPICLVNTLILFRYS